MKMKKISVLAVVLALALVTGTVTVFATSRPVGEKSTSADDSVSIQMTTKEEYLRTLQESIKVQDSDFSFTLPSAYTEKITLWIAGRIVEDGVSMSTHYLTAESDADSWKSGKTYSFTLEGKLSELLMSVTLDGEETILDLTAYLPEKHLYTETEPAKEDSELPQTYYSAETEVSAPSSEVFSEQAADIPEGQEDIPNTPITESREILSGEVAAEFPSISLSWPLPDDSGTISVYYGEKDHNGVDIVAEAGTSIFAAASGTVLSAGFDANEGNFVLIDHGGYHTLYCHCKSVSVKEGDIVSAGDCIGSVGSTGMATGPHLHFELQVNGSTANPIDYLQN